MGRLTILISRLATFILPVLAIIAVLAGEGACKPLAGLVILLPFAVLAISTLEDRDRLTILAAIAVYVEIAILVYLKTG